MFYPYNKKNKNNPQGCIIFKINVQGGRGAGVLVKVDLLGIVNMANCFFDELQKQKMTMAVRKLNSLEEFTPL